MMKWGYATINALAPGGIRVSDELTAMTELSSVFSLEAFCSLPVQQCAKRAQNRTADNVIVLLMPFNEFYIFLLNVTQHGTDIRILRIVPRKLAEIFSQILAFEDVAVTSINPIAHITQVFRI